MLSLVILIVAVISEFFLAAQRQGSEPAQGSPSGREIFEKYLAASGGMEARKALESLALSGQFGFNEDMWHPLGSYAYTYKASSSDVLEVEMISHGVAWTGHNNGESFKRATIGGVAMINGVDIGLIEEDYFTCVEWDLSRYTSIDVIGQAKIEKRPTYKVQFTTQLGDPMIRYYDTETFLLLRMDVVLQDRQNAEAAPIVIESYFSDYRDYGAIKFPRIIYVKRTIRPLTFKIDKLKPNVKIADSVFQ